MLGCRCGAKWNAAEYVDEAVAGGLTVHTRARVDRVLFDGTRAVGVSGYLGRRPFTARAPIVVLAAGGIGSPRILQRSGVARAGEGMAMDVTVMVYGLATGRGAEGRGIGKEPPMTWSCEDDDAGYMLSTLMDPWLLYPAIAAQVGLRPLGRWTRWRRILGLMIKLKDDLSGGVLPGQKISKPLTPADNERLKHARQVCEKILLEAGAKPNTLFMTPQRGAHPSATVRIGDLVDEHLQTQHRGLYVCDASVFPEALDRPTVLTIIALARRLAKHLSNTDKD
jgi:choline dehydrogenase-like flavoprotein